VKEQQDNQETQEQPAKELSKKHLDPKVWIAILSIAVIVVVYIVITTGTKEQEQPVPPPQPLDDSQQAIDTSDWETYQNEVLGVEFVYPSEYKKIEEDLRGVPFAIFANSPDCSDGSIFKGGDRFQNCFLLQVWQQPVSYRDESSDTIEEIVVGEFTGKKLFDNRFGVGIYVVELPRDKESLVILYAYNMEDSNTADKIFAELLDSLKLSDEKYQVEGNIEPKEPIPEISVNLVESIKVYNSGNLVTLVDQEDSTCCVEWSPDGSNIAYLGFNFDDGQVALFGSSNTGIYTVETREPYIARGIIAPGNFAHTHLSWSPDSRYLSYIIDDGAGIGMIDTRTGEKVLEFISGIWPNGSVGEVPGGARPLTWVDDTHYSYIFDGTLYLGTLENPKEKVVASDANNTGCAFESARPIFAPKWSENGEYVMYTASDSGVIINVKNNERHEFGSLDESESVFCNPSLNIESIGWRNNEFLFVQDGSVKSIDALSGEIETKLDPDLERVEYELLEDRDVVALYDYDKFSQQLYSLSKRSYVCGNLKLNRVLTSNDKYLLASLDIPQLGGWNNAKVALADEIQKIINIINIDNCENVGSFTVHAPRLNFKFSR